MRPMMTTEMSVWFLVVICISEISGQSNVTVQQITPSPPVSTTPPVQFPSTVTRDNVTTTPETEVCRDTIDTCSHYGHTACTQSRYTAWAKAHCALYCGFCIPETIALRECQDKVPNCKEYDDGLLCTAESYYQWAYENCRKYCHLGICNNTICEDDPEFNCAAVNSVFNLCADIPKAMQVCRKFCNLCDVVPGEWSNWSSFGACDVTCNNGTESRTRTCTNPAPAHGGPDCEGPSTDARPCTLDPCPVNGHWSLWTGWGSCSVTCGVGMLRRDRYCSNPYPARNGDHCFGEGVAYKICLPGACEDGGWSEWEEWGNCSSSGCEAGMRSRERTCTNPTPSPLGKQCLGDAVDTELCGNDSCSESIMSAFTATGLGNGILSTTVKFSTILLNEGDNYNSTSGIFTCEYPGVYHFTVSLTKARGVAATSMYCYIRLNNSNKVYIHVEPHADSNSRYGSYSASASATFHLHQNDTVNLGGCSSYSYFDSSSSVFSGFLVKED